MNILALDPGLNGGFALYEPGHENGRITVGVMPVVGGEINIKSLVDINRFGERIFNVKVYIEKVGAMPGQGVCSMFTFGVGYGKLQGMCQALDWPFVLVTPQAWKKEVLAGTNKDKDAAIKIANRLYPQINLIPEGKRKPHDGIADALCLLTYAMRKEGVIGGGV